MELRSADMVVGDIKPGRAAIRPAQLHQRLPLLIEVADATDVLQRVSRAGPGVVVTTDDKQGVNALDEPVRQLPALLGARSCRS